MDAARMRPEEAAACRWIGYAFRKGVTHPGRGITAWGPADAGHSGLHGELVQPFGGADAVPRCYERDSALGFGGFFRWVRFVSPDGTHRVLGLDWSLTEAPHIGVATAVLDVCDVAHALLAHGLPPSDELALLNDRMCEHPDDERWRREESLVTLADWARSRGRYEPGSGWCPTCGRRTLTDPSFRFCHQCGRNPTTLLGGSHGLEMQ